MYTKNRAYIEITNVCDGSCSFCPGTKRKKAFMSLADFDYVTDQVRPFTDLIYLHVMGEPLLHPELFNMIALAKRKGFRVGITTNGRGLSTKGSDLIAAAPYKVQISVHSFEEGSDEKYLNYLHSSFEFAKRASENGILTVLRLWNRGYDKGRNLNTVAALERFLGVELTLSDKGARISEKLHLEFGDRFEWPDTSSSDLGDRVFCHGMKDQFAVLCGGTVTPCCLDHEGDVDLGNIFDTPLGVILSSSRAVAIADGFRRHKTVEELCRKCPYARRFKA